MDDKKKGVIRHTLTTIGGMLVAFGLVTEGEVQTLVSAAVILTGLASTLSGFIASWRAKS